MAFIQITAPGDVIGLATACVNLLTSATETHRAALQNDTPEGKAMLKFYVELMALPLEILTKVNRALKIDPLEPPKPGIAGPESDSIEDARAELARLL